MSYVRSKTGLPCEVAGLGSELDVSQERLVSRGNDVIV
jgi:hypothetical protein